MAHRALLAAALFTTSCAAFAADLVVVRVNAPASLVRNGDSSALTPQRAISAGDVVSAGARGKVALQLGSSGSMTLSSLGDVQVFEAKAASGKQPAIAKLKLLAGALRVDSRASKGKPAQDIRLNVGSLKFRLLNSDAWAANTAEGDTLCLMAGAASVQGEGLADERLDQPGSCIRREPDGRISRFVTDNDAVILGAIAATRFEGPAVAAANNAIVAAEEKIAASAPIIAATAKPAAAPPAPAASTGSGWTIVVMSMSKPEPIAARAQALVQQGLPASTRTAVVNGATMHRVAVGQFATRTEARAYAAGTLAKSGIKGWPAPL